MNAIFSNAIRSTLLALGAASLVACSGSNLSAGAPADGAQEAPRAAPSTQVPADGFDAASPRPSGISDAGSLESIDVVQSCGFPGAPSATELDAAPDVPYGSDPAQRLNVVWPKTPGAHPLVVLIHGGGWWRGDKVGMMPYARKLATLGYVTASIDYRLVQPDAGSQRFPTQVSDVRCALRYLRANATAYTIDSSRVAALGLSAGAHLAAMLGVGERVAGLDDGSCSAALAAEPIAVNAVVGFYTPTDFRNANDWVTADGGTASEHQHVWDMLGGTADVVPEVAAAASPITHVAAGDPPFLLLHGTADTTVPVSQSRTFVAALHAAGVKATLVEVPGAEHGFPAMSTDYVASSCTTLSFLQNYLTP